MGPDWGSIGGTPPTHRAGWDHRGWAGLQGVLVRGGSPGSGGPAALDGIVRPALPRPKLVDNYPSSTPPFM